MNEDGQGKHGSGCTYTIITSAVSTFQVGLVRCYCLNQVHGLLCTTEPTNLGTPLPSAFSAHQHILDQEGKTRQNYSCPLPLLVRKSPSLGGSLKGHATVDSSYSRKVRQFQLKVAHLSPPERPHTY